MGRVPGVGALDAEEEIAQAPNQPDWQLAPGETVAWRAATVLDPATGERALLAFRSLVKAVAFMQPAVKAGRIGGVNKVGQCRAAVAEAWERPLRLNPSFDELRDAEFGAPHAVDAGAAVRGEA